MTLRLLARSRTRTLVLACILILGMLPVGAVTADSHRTSTRTDISFTSIQDEILIPGEEWQDAAGIYHLRGEVSREIVEGDINGELILTLDGDFIPSPNCDPDDPENCFEGEFSAWGTAVITDENGSWDGKFIVVFGFSLDEGEYSFGKAILAGRGGNAGKSIVVDITFGDDEEETAYFTGFMLTMAKPSFGVNMHTQLCFTEEETAYGAFVAKGAIKSSGAASGEFFTGGHWWTHTYGLYGEVVFTDDYGSLTIQFLGTAQDNWQTSVGWGHWVIVDGTGDYENVNGHGKVSGNAGEFAQCAEGWGVWLQFIGRMHMN